MQLLREIAPAVAPGKLWESPTRREIEKGAKKKSIGKVPVIAAPSEKRKMNRDRGL